MGKREQAARQLGRWVEPEEVYARGRALREAVALGAHRKVLYAADRPTVAEFVSASNAGRIPELAPLRVGRMLVSPFAFFRGSAGLMAADLAAAPRSGVDVQLCGDAHAANFGLYGTPEGKIVMDINDFDETVPGPWEWDLKRLATSIVLAGREGGVGEAKCREAAEDVVKSYRRTIDHLAEMPFLESWTALGDESALSKADADALTDDFAKAAKKARKNTSAKVAARWTQRGEDQRWRFIPDPPVLTEITAGTKQAVIDALPEYVDTLRESRRNLIMRYGVSDVAFRVVGTGSVGLRNYLVLLHGNGDEALVLQVKEARESALAPYVDHRARHEGKRVVHGARLVQAESDILLGWTTVEGRHFIVRQFRNRKGEIDATTLDADHLDDYGRIAGALLARAHSRSADPRLLAGYCGRDLDEAIGGYAVEYADRTEADHAELTAAVRAGRLDARTEA
ncbi:DUF2252 domain-containing protein [Actinokineospora soli]